MDATTAFDSGKSDDKLDYELSGLEVDSASREGEGDALRHEHIEKPSNGYAGCVEWNGEAFRILVSNEKKNRIHDESMTSSEALVTALSKQNF